MKTIIAACTITLASTAALAQSGPFGNPDLGGLQYPVTMSDPIPSGAKTASSLDRIQRGNPDGYAGIPEGSAMHFAGSVAANTSLDVLMAGNPDHGYEVDLGHPVVGSSEATAVAAHR